ncbi:DUF3021 domain-containing protein [uncultured Ligilactobacillus sp.]|uniref:DUF3021 domain-containing protein n=1 Tax=uncultured Ligilactobacillus sp. TaxID=2837633 RepID=UPI00272AEDD9|nr:DUF3021 domain-containing protein [uncultured Ligilactobacillus sp.]
MKIFKKIISASCSGIAIGVILSVIFSSIFGQGGYMPSTPTFMELFSTPVKAMTSSIILWALMGNVFYFSESIFAQERWSLLKMSLLHYLVTLICFFPLAYLAGWFPHNILWIAGFLLIYTGVYLIIYLGSYLSTWLEIKKINQKIK